MKDTKRNLRIAHLNLDVACWEDKLTEKGLFDDDIELYEDAIKDAKDKLDIEGNKDEN